MARPNAPHLHAGSSRSPNAKQDRDDAQAAQAPRKGWPFAEGSQNHLDEANAPWPRPARTRVAPPADPENNRGDGRSEPAQ
jgi:hypothetical protein